MCIRDSSSNSIITNGANALKIEEDIKNEELSSNNLDSSALDETSNNLPSETIEQNEVSQTNQIDTNFETKIEEQVSENNGLENFELSEDDTPELFNSDNNDDLPVSSEETSSEEEDLEIPAFLRRQKN